jgi:hypothetical protein
LTHKPSVAHPGRRPQQFLPTPVLHLEVNRTDK